MSMRSGLVCVVFLVGCRSAPAPTPQPSEREMQLESELIKTKAALARAESVIAAQRQMTTKRDPDPAVEPEPDNGMPAECNAYRAAINRMMTCDKMKSVAGAMKDGFDSAWGQMKDLPPEGKAVLVEGCKSATDAIEQSLKAMGC